MTITIKSNPDGVSGAIQVNGVDKVTIGASGITAGSFAPNSIDAAAAALAFSGVNRSFASNGYQKLPSGLIIQWGNGVVGWGSLGAVGFPVVFPTACLAGVASVANTAAGYAASVGALGVGSMQIFHNAPTNQSINWIAIGY